MDERRGIAVAEMLNSLFFAMTHGQDRVLSYRADILMEAENWMRVRWFATLFLDGDYLPDTFIPGSFFCEERTILLTWNGEAERTGLSEDWTFEFIEQGSDVEIELGWDSTAIPSDVVEAGIRFLDAVGAAERLLDRAGAGEPDYSIYPERIQLFLRRAVRTYRSGKCNTSRLRP